MTRSNPSHLTVLLAMGLGASLTYALSVGEAVGYPAGATISKGTNPVFSHGGVTHANIAVDVFTAPSDQTMIITDVSLGASHHAAEGCRAVFEALVQTDGGRMVGRYTTGMSSLGQTANQTRTQSYNSGLRVEPGETLNLSFSEGWHGCSWNDYRVNYVFSGYYAEP